MINLDTQLYDIMTSLLYSSKCICISYTCTGPMPDKDAFNYLESKSIIIIPHPPNSSDLAPSDFWLFERKSHRSKRLRIII